MTVEKVGGLFQKTIISSKAGQSKKASPVQKNDRKVTMRWRLSLGKQGGVWQRDLQNGMLDRDFSKVMAP